MLKSYQLFLSGVVWRCLWGFGEGKGAMSIGRVLEDNNNLYIFKKNDYLCDSLTNCIFFVEH